MIQDFARVLREKIRTDMNNYADDLAGGGCRTFEPPSFLTEHGVKKVTSS